MTHLPAAPGPRPGPVLPITAPTTGAPSAEVAVEVAHALARLEELDGRPVHEHVEVFDGVHRLLQDALTALDEA